jgi:hypothetical protein
MDWLEARFVDARETGWDLLELDARSSRIGVTVKGAHQIGPIRSVHWLEILAAIRSPGRAESRSR